MTDVSEIDLAQYRQIVILTGAGISMAPHNPAFREVLRGRSEELLPRLLRGTSAAN